MSLVFFLGIGTALSFFSFSYYLHCRFQRNALKAKVALLLSNYYTGEENISPYGFDALDSFLIDFNLLTPWTKIIDALSLTQLSGLLATKEADILTFLNQSTMAWLIFSSLPNYYFISCLSKLDLLDLRDDIRSQDGNIFLCECGWHGETFDLHDCSTKYRMVKFDLQTFQKWSKNLQTSIDQGVCLITQSPLKSETTLAILSCGHCAPVTPTIRWIQQYYTCFLCRQPVSSYQFAAIGEEIVDP